MRSVGAAVVMLAMLQAGSEPPVPKDFKYERAVDVGTGTLPEACAVLDGAVYAHSPTLSDLRLFSGGAQVPYAVLTSQTAAHGDSAEVLNAGMRGQHLVFDLEMPDRAYSRVDLELNGHDFLAAAKVTGRTKLVGGESTHLGTFTLFDLAGQRLGRSTAVDLAESRFPYLHVDLAFSAPPGQAAVSPTAGMIVGAEIPPSREAQTLYTVVAESSQIVQKGRDSVAEFELPAHVPVERVSFVLADGDKTNFSRSVKVTAKAVSAGSPERQEVPYTEEIGGEISRVKLTEGGQEIREESLNVPATLGSNGQVGAKVAVAVENGDDRPLALKAVQLEMRQRKVCFDVPGAAVTLFYGDDGLRPAVYDYSRLFSAAAPARVARLRAETLNPEFAVKVERRSFMERYPQVLWVALMAAVGALGFVAYRSGRMMGK